VAVLKKEKKGSKVFLFCVDNLQVQKGPPKSKGGSAVGGRGGEKGKKSAKKREY